MDPNLSLQMMQMITGGVVAQSISVAAELGIADLLADQPQTTAQLAVATASDASRLYRVLRFLASVGMFRIDADGAWSLTPLATLLRSDVPGSLRAGARMMGRMSAIYPYMTENVRTGKCAYDLAFGKPIFEDLPNKPEDAAIFDAAMNSFHGSETEAVLNAWSYDGITTLADIGCGAGAVMIATLQRYPAMRGILFDMAHVLERTAGNIRARGLESRCELRIGSFFESIPAGADAYTMRHIIHDWQDEMCVKILSNVRKVIPASGRLLIIESVVPEGNDPSPSKFADVLMMIVPNGMERTESQFRHILTASGFALSSITPTQSPVSVIEARPV